MRRSYFFLAETPPLTFFFTERSFAMCVLLDEKGPVPFYFFLPPLTDFFAERSFLDAICVLLRVERSWTGE